MSTAEYEPAIPGSKWPHTDSAVTGCEVNYGSQKYTPAYQKRNSSFSTALTKPKGITGNYEIRNDSLNIVLVTVDSLQHVLNRTVHRLLSEAGLSAGLHKTNLLSVSD
jgi:hypothetical protein